MVTLSHQEVIQPEYYTNFISLGFFCSPARVLKGLGLRTYSGPFDWTISPWNSVWELFNNNFADFLNYDDLYQASFNPDYYINKRYNISFYHDFSRYSSLAEQIDKVAAKYKRRIDRFYKELSNPTMLIRYIQNEAELRTLEMDYNLITLAIKY